MAAAWPALKLPDTPLSQASQLPHGMCRALNQKIIPAFDLPPTQRVPRAIRRIASIDETVHQVLIAPSGNAQARGLDNLRGHLAHVFDIQQFLIEALGIPHRHFQAQCLAQQRLACTQLLRGAWAAIGVGVVQQHLRQARRPGNFVDPGIGRFDQVRGIIPVRSDLTDGSTWHV